VCTPASKTIKTGPLDRFPAEFRAAWQQMPDKGLFLVLLLPWLGLFHFLGNSTFGYVASPSLFGWMYQAYNYEGSEDAHGNLVPLVVLGLLWWKRKRLLASPKSVWWPGLIWLGLAAAMHVLAYVVQQPRLSIVALFAGVYALLALVWGKSFARASLFPFVLFGFCIPLGALAEPVSVPLRQTSTNAAVVLARHCLGIPVLQEGVQIMDPKGTYSYEVAAACSGIHSLVTLLALTTIYGAVSFRTSWRRLLMVGLAFPLALLNNVARLVSIVVAAEAFGREAGQFVHEWFGFVTFIGAMAVMLAVGRWLQEPAVGPGGAPAMSGA
jgi:exosortase